MGDSINGNDWAAKSIRLDRTRQVIRYEEFRSMVVTDPTQKTLEKVCGPFPLQAIAILDSFVLEINTDGGPVVRMPIKYVVQFLVVAVLEP